MVGAEQMRVSLNMGWPPMTGAKGSGAMLVGGGGLLRMEAFIHSELGYGEGILSCPWHNPKHSKKN